MASAGLLVLLLTCCLLYTISNNSEARPLDAKAYGAGTLIQQQKPLDFLLQRYVMQQEYTPWLFLYDQGNFGKVAMYQRQDISFRESELPSLEDMLLPALYEEESSHMAMMHSHEDMRLLEHDYDRLFLEPELRSSDKDMPSSIFQNHDLSSSIPALLNQSGLPIGLLPSSVASYAITAYGDFIVSLQESCYVDFDYEVYYAQTITGRLGYGTITNLSGIQAKEAFFWLPITAIRTDIPRSGFIYFNVGPISKKLPISQFETIPTCKAKSMAL